MSQRRGCVSLREFFCFLDLSHSLLLNFSSSPGLSPVNGKVLAPFIIDTEIAYMPTKAGFGTELSFSVLTNADMEIGDVIRLTLKNFTGGMWCWTSDEYKDQRCMLDPNKDEILCSSCRLRDGRYSSLCECRGAIGSPTCSALPIEHMGCAIRVMAVAAPTVTPNPVRIGAAGCECLNVSDLTMTQTWSEIAGPDRPRLPRGYGVYCAAWDYSLGFSTLPEESEGPSCSELWPVATPTTSMNADTSRAGNTALMESQLGQRCCLPWCFVNASLCKSHEPWAGGAGYHVSYDTCASSNRKSELESCPFPPLPPREGFGLKASWLGTLKHLVLTLTEPFQRGSKLSVVVMASNGIRLPEGGLEKNDPFLFVDARNRVGSMKPFQIEVSPPVGVQVGRATVKFGAPAASQAVSVTIDLAFSQQLEPGEVSTMLMPL